MRRWVIGWGYSLLALPLAVACGGNVEGGSREPKETEPASKPGTPASNQSSGSDDPDADIDLGECTLGTPENRATDNPCAWVADHLCYETREMACNCVCPRSRDSHCSSGFEAGPDGHVWVACH